MDWLSAIMRMKLFECMGIQMNVLHLFGKLMVYGIIANSERMPKASVSG